MTIETARGRAPRRTPTAPQPLGSGTGISPQSLEAGGVLALTAGSLLLLALISFGGRPGEAVGGNWIGPVGAVIADGLFFACGLASLAISGALLYTGGALILRRPVFTRPAVGAGSVTLLVVTAALIHVIAPSSTLYGHRVGGWLGATIGEFLGTAIGRLGAGMVCLGVGAIALIFVTDRSLVTLGGVVAQWARTALDRLGQWRRGRAELRALGEQHAVADRETDEPEAEAEGDEGSRWAAFRESVVGLLRRPFRRREQIDSDSTNDGDDWYIDEREPGIDDEPAPVAPRAGRRHTRSERVEVSVASARSERISLGAAGSDDDDDPPWVDELEPVAVRPARAAAPVAHVAAPAPAELEVVPPIAGGRRMTGRFNVESESTAAERTSAPPVAPRGAAELGPVIVESEAQKNRKRDADLERAQQMRLLIAEDVPGWEFPPLSFLSFRESDGTRVDRDRVRDQAALIERVLADFKVLGRVTAVCPGPVVTRYEYEPDAGTKLSKISGLLDNIKMGLRARSIRIIAPIPGKGCVGIEVPNDEREAVYLKELIADPSFTQNKSKLAICLGKDVEGKPVVTDLSKMPHLLVAGTTGSGKSVAVNAMITSILYNASPEDVKMIMIDPKMLEFSVYKDIPHLLLPVVTEPDKAATALQWVCAEMDRRYRLMAEMHVRNITGYNEKLEELSTSLQRNDGAAHSDHYTAQLAMVDADGQPAHRHMHYILVIVDEFADLMMVAGKEVEQAVARLAQKARAAGIHVILATQRPSVDVITGLIKANFPTRISFRLMSGTDSRTVLDTIGAEELLGMGDMLFRPPGRSDLVRVHGAYVDEGEIEKVVDFLRAQRGPEYDDRILQFGRDASEDEVDDGPVDELYDKAVEIVLEAGFASISYVQRKLNVGYNRSARMVERMERDGLVGPAVGGSGRREVLGGARQPGGYNF